jgi:hypothetical protein
LRTQIPEKLWPITASRERPVEGEPEQVEEEITVTNARNVFKVASVFATLTFLASVLTPAIKAPPILAAPAEAAPAFPPGQSAAASSLPADVLISPEDLAKLLQSHTGEKPLTIHVGFYVLYSQAHIPGSEYIGPASQEEVLAKLRRRVEPLPRKKFIVLYCGCCPWNHCPTVKPAYETLHSMGFTKLKVLYIPNNFGQDWVNKGFPVEKGQ